MQKNSPPYCLPYPPVSICTEPATSLGFELFNTPHKTHTSLLQCHQKGNVKDVVANHVIKIITATVLKINNKDPLTEAFSPNCSSDYSQNIYFEIFLCSEIIYDTYMAN